MARGHLARLGGRARNEGRFDMACETGLNRNAITDQQLSVLSWM